MPPLPGRPHRRTLDNGLRVLVLENRQAPLVTTAMTFPVGARHDPPDAGGTAHFLEHLMFKGSAHYGAGEIDALAQRLGGEANALTWHDATLYYFQFASDRWSGALDIEADRMAALTLDPLEIERERSVVLEELAIAADDPWQAFEEVVHATFFGQHPYGRPIAGRSDEVRSLDRLRLDGWHRRHYGPDRALLTIAGDVGVAALDLAERTFEKIPRRGAELPPSTPREPAMSPRRIELRRGVVPRWMMTAACPPPGTAELAAVRMATAVLALGRCSRLHRALVEEEELCAAVGCTVLESVEPGCIDLTAEPHLGVPVDVVEARVLDLVAGLARRPPTDEELERARALLVADWLFAHETIVEQAITAGFAAAVQDLGHPQRQLQAVVDTEAEAVVAAAEAWLVRPADAVIGRCLPESNGG